MDAPRDIQETAEMLASMRDSVGFAGLIVTALWTERLAQKERDAKMAEETGKAYSRDHFVMMGPAGIAHKVAHAIRRS